MKQLLFISLVGGYQLHFMWKKKQQTNDISKANSGYINLGASNNDMLTFGE